MKSDTRKNTSPTLYRAFLNFIDRLRQNPDVYPIKYYKKSRRFKRNWQENIVK